MSDKDLWAALGRGLVDPQFGERLSQSPEQAEQVLTEGGFTLTGEERQRLAQVIAGLASSAEDVAAQREDMKKRMEAATSRSIDLSEYTVTLFKTTLNNASKTYKNISLMNQVMFWVGIGLFVSSAIYGVITKEAIALGFAGMGVLTFVAVFLTGPMDRSQAALANLVQADIAFMDFFEQITFIEAVGFTPTGTPPSLSVANVERASELLQKRSSETIALLQKYLEPKGGVENGAVEADDQEDPREHPEHPEHQHPEHQHPHEHPEQEHPQGTLSGREADRPLDGSSEGSEVGADGSDTSSQPSDAQGPAQR